MAHRGGRSGRGSRSDWGWGRRGGGRGGGDGAKRGRGECADYKLLGECQRDGCAYSHMNRERTVCKSVEIPERVHMTVATRGEILKHLQGIAECRLRKAGSDMVEIVVSECNARSLPKLERKYKVLVSQLFPIGPGWCYIHRDGVEQCQRGGLLHFRKYEGRLPLALGHHASSQKLLELCMTAADSDESECTEFTVESPQRESETREGLHKAIDRAHGEGESRDDRRDVGVKIIKDHETHMKEMLKGGLEWFCTEKSGYIAKLEGRFGKILWKNVPEDMLQCSWGIDKFADLCFSDTRHSRIFNTDVKQVGADAVKRQLEDERVSVLETFDVKFTNPRAGTERIAVDVRIKFEQDRPTILHVKRNEVKIVVFDVLSLHRNHDIRMTLNYYEVMTAGSPEYEVVEKLVRTVSLSDPEKKTITLETRTDDWNVNFIRHKTREAYRIDDKYIVTVATIRESWFNKQLSNTYVSVTPDLYHKTHTEIEFHNLTWECAFGWGVDFSPEKSLALLMENPAAPPEITGVIPHPWQPDHILEDFQEFWENLDSLNAMLEPSA